MPHVSQTVLTDRRSGQSEENIWNLKGLVRHFGGMYFFAFLLQVRRVDQYPTRVCAFQIYLEGV